MRIVNIAGAVLLLSAPVFAQDEVARKQAVEVAARVPFETAVKGAPYSAETVVEGTQTLADGNRITRKTTGQVYRDSEGRTRREEDREFSAIMPQGPMAARMTAISIIDPVAGVSYSLDPEHKIAWMTPIGGANAIMGKLLATRAEADTKLLLEKLKAEQRGTVAAGRGAGAGAGVGSGGVRARSGGEVSLAPLEHKTIDGVAVEGRKTSTVIPAGQIGNEQPITVTSEEWRSPELNLLVLTKHSDPRSGDSSYRLQNIIRAEPDHSLFVVPSDYTVKETGIRRMEEASRKQ
jgi:hypothetical protein